MTKLPKIIAIVGPTASGKTALGVKLARQYNGEVISADSRAVYKEMNIGTAKPVPNEQQNIAHHLIDIVSPNQPYTLADYQRDANKAIRGILERGKLPIIVGGTGLYVNAIIYNYALPKVAVNPKIRAKFEALPSHELYALLKKLDPETAAHIDPANPRRLVRALEVKLATGQSIYSQQKQGAPQYDALVIGLNLDNKTLKERIKARVEQMLEAGLENEVRSLVAKYGWQGALINTIKYQEWRPYFENKITYPQLLASLIKADTMYVKRQLTWFKKLKNVHWFNTPPEALELTKEFLI